MWRPGGATEGSYAVWQYSSQNPIAGSPRSHASNLLAASSPCWIEIIARSGSRSPAAVNVGSRVRAAFSFTTEGPDLPALDPLAVLTRHRVGLEHVQVALRVGVRDHDRRAEHVAALELDALARDDPRDRDPGRERRSRLEGRLRDRERDPAHPADDVAPFDARPSTSPWECIRCTDAVPGSRGPA